MSGQRNASGTFKTAAQRGPRTTSLTRGASLSRAGFSGRKTAGFPAGSSLAPRRGYSRADAERRAAKRSVPHEAYEIGDGTFGVRKVQKAAQRKPQRDTGPSPRDRAIVLARDGHACVRCGRPCGPGIAPYSLQHRVARGVGGRNEISGLLLLCGSALTGCHGEVESRRYPEDHDKGYRLESWQDPLLEGVMYFEQDGSGVTKWLEDDGGLLDEPPAGRAA